MYNIGLNYKASSILNYLAYEPQSMKSLAFAELKVVF